MEHISISFNLEIMGENKQTQQGISQLPMEVGKKIVAA